MAPTTPAPRVKFDLHPYVYVSDSGQPVRLRADDGAVTQEGSKPCFQCDCGAVLVWVKSARTGRNYLAHCVKRSDYDSYYYMKNMPHTHERHAEKLAEREALAALVARDMDRECSQCGSVGHCWDHDGQTFCLPCLKAEALKEVK